MRKLILLTTTLALTSAAVAQDLNLFEPIEEPAEQGPVRGPEVAQPVAGGQPAFYLRGVSRFGDRVTTLLVDRSGNAIKVPWTPGQTVEVPGFSGYVLTGADSRSVTLQFPGNDSCVASDTLGVSCTSPSSGRLSLTPAAALAVNGSSPQPVTFSSNGRANAAEPAVLVDSNGQQVFINPFSGEPEVVPQLSEEERAAREARQRERAARLGAFEVQRINPEDVRPGMRVVRTPFGDREVPIRE